MQGIMVETKNMSTKFTYPNRHDIEKISEVATELFGTDEDETQAQPTVENTLKLILVEKHDFICLKNAGNLVAWSAVLPTSKELMEQFLNRTINERELFDLAVAQPCFECLYLVAAIVLPKWRRRGIGTSLMKAQIEYFKNKYKINIFYALILTKEGKKLIGALERDLGASIPCREN